MKTVTLALVMLLGLLVSGCVNKLPKPTNADGSLNPSVLVAEAKITYTNITNDAAIYTETCHKTTPAPIGCDERVIQQLKVQSVTTLTAINAAEQAVRTLRPGDTGIDRAINQMNAALIFLQSLWTSAKHPRTGMIEHLNVLEGVLA